MISLLPYLSVGCRCFIPDLVRARQSTTSVAVRRRRATAGIAACQGRVADLEDLAVKPSRFPYCIRVVTDQHVFVKQGHPCSPVSTRSPRRWRMAPGPLRTKLRSQGGRRFVRFAPAAVLARCATQLTYFVLQLAHVTGGHRRCGRMAGRRGRELHGQPLGVGAQGQAASAQGDPAVLAVSSVRRGHSRPRRASSRTTQAHAQGMHRVRGRPVSPGPVPGGQLRDFRDQVLDLPLRALRRPRIKGRRTRRESAPSTRSGPAPGRRRTRWHRRATGRHRPAAPSPGSGSGPSEDTGPIGGPSAADPRARR